MKRNVFGNKKKKEGKIMESRDRHLMNCIFYSVSKQRWYLAYKRRDELNILTNVYIYIYVFSFDAN